MFSSQSGPLGLGQSGGHHGLGGYLQNGGNTNLHSAKTVKLRRNQKGGPYYVDKTTGSIVAASDDIVVIVVIIAGGHCIVGVPPPSSIVPKLTRGLRRRHQCVFSSPCCSRVPPYLPLLIFLLLATLTTTNFYLDCCLVPPPTAVVIVVSISFHISRLRPLPPFAPIHSIHLPLSFLPPSISWLLRHAPDAIIGLWQCWLLFSGGSVLIPHSAVVVIASLSSRINRHCLLPSLSSHHLLAPIICWL